MASGFKWQKNCIPICDSLLKCNKNDPFLKRTITGNDKWITYNNMKQKKVLWGGAKWATLNHPKRWYASKGDAVHLVLKEHHVLKLSLFWKIKCWIQTYYFPNGLKAAIKKYLELPNQKSVIFHQDNTRPHVYLQTQHKLIQLGCNVLLCPPYSHYFMPLNYYLFQFLQNSLNGKNFNSLDVYKNHLNQFSTQKFWN